MQDRDYGDETDYSYYDDEDEFYFDEEEDDEDDSFGTFIPSNPYPKSPSPGDTIKMERELTLV